MTNYSAQQRANGQGPVFTGLSGNELWCLDKIGFRPGDLVIGNSVYSMGFLGGLRSVGRSIAGGELTQFTEIIYEGRRLALSRLEQEVTNRGAMGVTGVSTELVEHVGNIEFLSVGSALYTDEQNRTPFTTSSSGQDLFCQVDANYFPMRLVLGNVVYSMGAVGGVIGSFRSSRRGEVKEFSDIFNTTRHLALSRIEHEARSIGANSVVGMNTQIVPFAGAHEMLVVGTASHHPQNDSDHVITSALTAEEHWTMASMGYRPLKYLMGTSVYSLGFVGGITSMFKNFVKGEISELTTLIYDARENALHQLEQQAEQIGADDVLGVRTNLYHLGNGVIEFLARGTAVKRVGVEGAGTVSEQLPPQAIVRDRDTFFDVSGLAFEMNLSG